MKKHPVIHYVVLALAIAINLFLIISAALPSTMSSNESGWVVALCKNIINTFRANTINDDNIGTFSSVIRKLVGHFSTFLVSGVLTTLSYRFFYYEIKHKRIEFFAISLLTGLFIAALTERIQSFTPGRSCEFRDIMIDFCGYVLGFTIIAIISIFSNKKSSNIEKQN